MSRATNPSMKLVKGACCGRKVTKALSYRNFWERILPAGLYRPLSSLRRTVSEKKSGFSPLSARPERRAPSSAQKDFNVARNSEIDPFTVICTFPIAYCSRACSSDRPGSQAISLYRLLKLMSISSNGPKLSEELLSDKSTCGIMGFEVTWVFRVRLGDMRGGEAVLSMLTSFSIMPSFKALGGTIARRLPGGCDVPAQSHGSSKQKGGYHGHRKVFHLHVRG